MKGIALSVVISSFILLVSCSKSGGPGTGSGGNNGGGGTVFVPNCTGAATSFSADVFPIFQTVCGQSGCHNAGSLNGPGSLTTYAQINAAKALIRPAIISALMPQGTSLTSAQKNSIICWIDAGAANN